jgi:AcrR family transcriptional regulator
VAPGTRGPYRKSDETRAAILDRATALIAELGPERVSLRRIADDLGISHPALTYYFASRDELLVAVLDEGERRAKADVGEVGTVQRMRGYSRRNEESPGTIQLYLSLAARALNDDGVVRAHIAERFERVRRNYAERIVAEQADGAIRRDIDSNAIAALLVAAMDGLQLQHLLNPNLDQESSLAILEEILQTPEPPTRTAVTP